MFAGWFSRQSFWLRDTMKSVSKRVSHNVRACLAEPIRIHFDVQASGKFNRAYAGYVTPGKLAPLLEWKTELASPTRIQTLRNTSETLT